jgi:hypothetical protein
MILVKTMANLIRDKQEHTSEVSFSRHKTHQIAMVTNIFRDGKGEVSGGLESNNAVI